MSRKRQLWEIKQLGAKVDSTDEALRLFVREDPAYPKGKASLTLPALSPAHLKTAALLHHKTHLERKIKDLNRQVRELRREGRMALRDRCRRLQPNSNPRLMISGLERVTCIYNTHMSLRRHCQLLMTIDKQLKIRQRMHRNDTRPVYVDELADPILPTTGDRGQRRPNRSRYRCRHHSRKGANIPVAEERDGPVEAMGTQTKREKQ